MLYMVTMVGKPMSCGTLGDCWRYVVEFYGKDMRVAELINADVTIEPAKAGLLPGQIVV